MTVWDLQSSIDDGRCSWAQVYETLISARLSRDEVYRFMEGRLALEPSADAMLRQLIDTGEVPRTLAP
jgi:hypothetical protein